MSALDAIAKKLLKTQELKALQQQKEMVDSGSENMAAAPMSDIQSMSPSMRTAVTEINGNVRTGNKDSPALPFEVGYDL